MRLWLKSSTLLCRAKANSISSIRCWYLWLFSSLVMMMMMANGDDGGDDDDEDDDEGELHQLHQVLFN